MKLYIVIRQFDRITAKEGCYGRAFTVESDALYYKRSIPELEKPKLITAVVE